jgi:GNAT superfamily N-acetyltransferase
LGCCKKKAELAKKFRQTIKDEGAVLAASEDGLLKGFSVIEAERFGRKYNYLELSYIHVIAESRNRGIWKVLFDITLQAAKNMAGDKLYIGAHPAVETQHFSQKNGMCTRKGNQPPHLQQRNA